MKLLVKLLLIFICFGSCQEKTETEANEGFDIFLIAGQSNTLNGMGILPNIDSISSGICQLGRHGVTDYKVLEAIDPLEHWDKRIGKIGFGLTFAKLYWKCRSN